MSEGKLEILDSASMASIDRRAIDELGIPAIVLMENAGIAVSDLIDRDFAVETVGVVCGSGNNGGDGFVIARQLHSRGYAVSIVRLGNSASMSEETRTNFETCRALFIPILEPSSDEDLAAAADVISEADLLVDAMFGTGLDRPAEGLHASVIELMNATGIPTIAVDIPSGLNGSSSSVNGPAVQADVTVTFVRPKIANILDPAAQLCGELVIADISIPDEAVEAEQARLFLITADYIRPTIAARPPSSHKGTWGHIGILAGSVGKTGAAILAARGAHRAGAGLVTIATDESSQRLVAEGSAESMTIIVHPASPDEIIRAFEDRAVAAIGPGLDSDPTVLRAVRDAVAGIGIPLVIDATGLDAFAGDLERLRKRSAPTVLTPHPGEMARLLGRPTMEITGDRLGAAAEAANATGAIVVLKGHQTVVASPDGTIGINSTGNPGMATGGMGDVLTGMIAAMLARSDDPLRSVCAAVYLHGLAGDLVAEQQGEIGMTALDLADAIPASFRLEEEQ